MQNSLEVIAVNNCHKKLDIKIYYGVLDLPRLIFQIYISKRLCISPNIFKNELNVCTQISVQQINIEVYKEVYKKYCNWCGTCPDLAARMPKQCLSCRLEVLVNFEEVCAQSFGAFIVDFEYFLFVVNVLNFSSFCKTLVCNCANDKP